MEAKNRTLFLQNPAMLPPRKAASLWTRSKNKKLLPQAANFNTEDQKKTDDYLTHLSRPL